MKNIINAIEFNKFLLLKVFLLVVALVILLFIQNINYATANNQMRTEITTEVRADNYSDSEQEEAVFCTADAYQCPNGEWVGRTGPGCEFVCSYGPVDRTEEIENPENENGNNRNEPGVIVAPSQTKVIIMPANSDDDNDSSPIKLNGIDIDFRDTDSDGDGLGDATESMMFGDGWVSVSVNGKTVRGWDPKIKEEIRARLNEANDRNNANDFGLFVAMQAIDHPEIQNIKVEENTTTITFETKLKVFGFIPVKVTAETIAQSNGEVKTSYPWWSFLARKSESNKISILNSIALNLATRIGVGQ